MVFWLAPARQGRIDLRWLLRRLGAENVTSLLVEGGGEVNASFLLRRLAQRVVFFYAPKIMGGRDDRKAVAGEGARNLNEMLKLRDVEWRCVGDDLMMTALVIGMVVGLLISIMQAVTQLHEQTLTFVPKIVAMGLATAVFIPWLTTRLIEYTVKLWGNYQLAGSILTLDHALQLYPSTNTASGT